MFQLREQTESLQEENQALSELRDEDQHKVKVLV